MFVNSSCRHGTRKEISTFHFLFIWSQTLKSRPNYPPLEMMQQRMEWLDSITDSVDMKTLSKPQKIVKNRGAWRAAVHGVTKELDTTW